MRTATNIREAAASLAAVRARSLMALFGIAIGIGAVIAIVSTSEIVRKESLRQFQELGTDILNVQKYYPSSARPQRDVTPQDVLDLPSGTRTIAAATGWTQTRLDVFQGGKSIGDRDVYGVPESFFDINRLQIAQGRLVSDLDARTYYCVVGSAVAEVLRHSTPGEVVGRALRVAGRLCTVIGVLRPAPARRFGQTLEPNDSVFLPIRTMMRTTGKHGIRQLIARMRPGAAPPAAARETAAFLRTRAPGPGYRVITAQQLIERKRAQGRLFTLLLGAVGSISLLVGGVGVMNVMLMSVNERRAEIGLRRAVGARRRDIRRQFVIESVMLCLAGGVLGVAVGVAGAWGLCLFAGWAFHISETAVAVGVGVSTGVGVFCGLYPAHRAARLDPIAALRS